MSKRPSHTLSPAQSPSLAPSLSASTSAKNWFRKLSSAQVLGHPLVWLLMTSLFILLGYLWLQFYAQPLADSIKQHNENKLIGARHKQWDKNIVKPIETQEQMQITQIEDNLRADDYRISIDHENTIRPLLLKARELLNRQAYTSKLEASKPKESKQGASGDGAWQIYQQILGLSPNDRAAVSGQKKIISLLQANAEIAVEEKDYELAEQWLHQLDTIQNQDPFQMKIRSLITQQINDDLAKAEAEQRRSEKKARLKITLKEAQAELNASPPNLRAAYDLYTRALEIEPKNAAASNGLTSIHSIRTDAAKLAISKNNFLRAQEEIDRLQETNANEKTLATLSASLDSTRARALLLQLQQAEITQQSQTLALQTPKVIEDNATINSFSDQFTDAQEATINSDQQTSVTAQLGDAQSSAEPIVDTTSVTVIAPDLPVVDISGTSNSAAALSPAQQLNKGINAYYAGQYDSAFEQLHPLAEANDSRAQFRLGIMYFKGRAVVKNTDLATQWITRSLPLILRAAQNDAAWAQADLGTAYELGIGLEQDLARAATWYQKAAKQGNAGAQANLGALYATGDGVAYDRQLALYWLKKAAIAGNKIAEENLKMLNAR